MRNTATRKVKKFHTKLKATKRKAKSTLPPDPEGYNDERAARGKAIIEVYHKLTGTDPSCSLGDLLSDPMHMCDRDPDFGTFEDELERAERSYEEETSTDEEYARH